MVGLGESEDEVREVLAGVPGIKFVEFDERDVVRHRLVQAIVRACDGIDTASPACIVLGHAARCHQARPPPCL